MCKDPSNIFTGIFLWSNFMEIKSIFKNNERIKESKITNWDDDSKPKSDGRVEVPKTIIKQIGWDNSKIIFISNNGDHLILSNNRTENIIGKTIVSYGRVRIPAGILRSTDLYRKELFFTIENNNLRVQTYSNGNLFLIENNLVVVPIKFPYKFAGIKVANGIFYLDEKEIFYLLPVIKLLLLSIHYYHSNPEQVHTSGL